MAGLRNWTERSEARTPVGCRRQVLPPSRVRKTTPSPPATQPSLSSMKQIERRDASSTWRTSLATTGAASARNAAMMSRIWRRMRGPSVAPGLPLAAARSQRSAGDPALLCERYAASGVSIRNPVAEDAKQRLDRVLQADLLALLVRPARITDRHLEDAQLLLCDLGRELRLQ